MVPIVVHYTTRKKISTHFHEDFIFGFLFVFFRLIFGYLSAPNRHLGGLVSIGGRRDSVALLYHCLCSLTEFQCSGQTDRSATVEFGYSQTSITDHLNNGRLSVTDLI